MSTWMEIENLRRLKVVLSAFAFMGLFLFSIADSSAQESYEFQRLGYRTYLDEDCDASKSPVSQLNPEARFQRVGYVNGESRRHATPFAQQNTATVRIRPKEQVLLSSKKSGLTHSFTSLNAQVVSCDNGRQVLLTNLHGIRSERRASSGGAEEFTQPSIDVHDPKDFSRKYRVNVPWDLMLKQGLSGYSKGWLDDYQNRVFNTDSDWAVIPMASNLPGVHSAAVCPTSKDSFERDVTSGGVRIFAVGYHIDKNAPRDKLLIDGDVIPVVDRTRSGINKRSFQFGYDAFPGSSGQGLYASARREDGTSYVCLVGLHSWMGSSDPIEDPTSKESVSQGLFATARLITDQDQNDVFSAIKKACEVPPNDLYPVEQL